MNGGWCISCEIALRWMPPDLTDDKSTLVQVMAWCRQAWSHYLSQCWPRSMSPNGVWSWFIVCSVPSHYLHQCKVIINWTHSVKFDKKQGKSEGFESCDRPIVRKRPIRVKSGDVLSRVTLKFDGWLWKTIGHLSFAVSSFVQHFITISEFKLELLSRNAQFR